MKRHALLVVLSRPQPSASPGQPTGPYDFVCQNGGLDRFVNSQFGQFTCATLTS